MISDRILKPLHSRTRPAGGRRKGNETKTRTRGFLKKKNTHKPINQSKIMEPQELNSQNKQNPLTDLILIA